MQLEQFHRLQGKLMFAHFGTLSPIVDRVADGGRSKIAAPILYSGIPPSAARLDLGASTPEEIALSVMSQIVALRRGGQATSLHPQEGILRERGAVADAVIRQCEADVTY